LQKLSKTHKCILLFLFLFSLISCGEVNNIGSLRHTEVFILHLEDSFDIYNPYKYKKYLIKNDTSTIEYKLRNYKGDLSYKRTDVKENTIYEGQFVRNKFFHKKYPAINE
jgi:hypothetical protein